MWLGMTVEELARAMEKDIGEPDNFTGKIGKHFPINMEYLVFYLQ